MSAIVKVTLGEVESVYRCTYPLARALEVILHHSNCAEEIKQEPKYCDRNICVSNEYNGIGCDECEVTKSQEPKTDNDLDMKLKLMEANINGYTQGLKDASNTEQEPKTGHWEWVQYDYNPILGNWHCSECRCIVVECVGKKEKGGIPFYKYCPQCGARMFEPQESEEV